MEITAKGVGDRIKKALVKRGLSEGHLAAECKVSQQAVNNWVLGKAVPRGKRLVKLCSVLGLSVESLLLGKDDVGLSDDQLKIAKMLFSLPANVQKPLIDRIAMFYATFSDSNDTLTASYHRYIVRLPKIN